VIEKYENPRILAVLDSFRDYIVHKPKCLFVVSRHRKLETPKKCVFYPLFFHLPLLAAKPQYLLKKAAESREVGYRHVGTADSQLTIMPFIRAWKTAYPDAR
jgi:hypothetical protein